MSVEWSGWLVAFLVAFVMFIWRFAEDIKDKKFLKCWVEKTLPNGVKTFSKEKKYIGEYKGESVDDMRDGYVIKIRRGTNTFELKSPANSVDIFNTWCDSTFAHIWRCLDMIKYDEELPESMWYKKKLELTKKAKIYLFLNSWLFDLKAVPIFAHIITFWIFWGAIFAGSIFVIPFSVPIVLTINAINHHCWGANSVKRKEVEVKSETHLVPVESDKIQEDIYEVHFYKRMKVELSDKTTCIQLVTWDPEAKNWKNIDGMLDSEIEKLKPTKMTATELIDIELNPEITILSKKVCGMIVKQLSLAEIKTQRKDFLAKSRYVWSQLQNAKRQIRDKNMQIKDLYEQLAYVEATKNKEIREMGDKMINEIKAQGLSLKEIYKQLQTAEFIEENFEATHERIVEKLDMKGYGKLNEMLQEMAKKQDKFENVMLKLISTTSTNHKNQDILKELLGAKYEPEKKEEVNTDV